MGEEGRKTGDAAIRRAFGKVLKRLRLQRGMTQEELAEEADATTNYISLLERGLEGPSLIRLFDLASALRVKPQLLVENTDSELAAEFLAEDSRSSGEPKP
jgi:transcriptional regulator with XRE-family HTH domain